MNLSQSHVTNTNEYACQIGLFEVRVQFETVDVFLRNIMEKTVLFLQDTNERGRVRLMLLELIPKLVKGY